VCHSTNSHRPSCLEPKKNGLLLTNTAQIPPKHGTSRMPIGTSPKYRRGGHMWGAGKASLRGAVVRDTLIGALLVRYRRNTLRLRKRPRSANKNNRRSAGSSFSMQTQLNGGRFLSTKNPGASRQDVFHVGRSTDKNQEHCWQNLSVERPIFYGQNVQIRTFSDKIRT